MMPSGWESKSIGGLNAYVTSGSRGWAAYYSASGDRFIRITNLQRDNINLDCSDMKFVSLPSGSQEGLRTKLQAGDILVSITADLGIVGYVRSDPEVPSYINQHIALIRIDSKDIHKEFIAHQLSSPQVQKRIQKLNDSGSKAGLSLDSIRNVEMEIPPFNEQEKIAKILSTWDEAIEKIGRLENHLAKTAQFFSSEVFSNSRNKKIKIVDALDFLRDGTHGTHANVDSGIPLLSAKDVGIDGKITMNAPRLISENEYRKIHSKYEISAGDVLLTIVGTIGRVAIVPEKFNKFSVQRSVAILRPNKNYRSDYLYYFLRSDLTQKWLQKSANASAQAGVYLGELAKLEIEDLNLKEQERVIEKLKVLDRRLYLTGLVRANLQLQKQGLMQQLLTGKRRVKV